MSVVGYQSAPLVHILRCDRETVLAMAERTRNSITPEELVFREAELGAVYVTAEISDDAELHDSGFLTDLWLAYDLLTSGETAGGAKHMAAAAEHLRDLSTGREETRPQR